MGGLRPVLGEIRPWVLRRGGLYLGLHDRRDADARRYAGSSGLGDHLLRRRVDIHTRTKGVAEMKNFFHGLLALIVLSAPSFLVMALFAGTDWQMGAGTITFWLTPLFMGEALDL
jgi:hypothetical protein